MSLVVPVLRFFVVFLNVYETFKTLKPPPPSSRRGGKPSVRAMSQRKRDLKGCLAVWVVWCCYAAYERTFDRAVGIFLPFYSEIKSVFLLFLVLTRAKGAEPLFLHVLRPLVKPYTAVVDPLLELSCDIGDFCFALLQVPLDYFVSLPWARFWCPDPEEECRNSPSGAYISSADSGGAPLTNNHSSILNTADHSSTVQTCRVPSKYHGPIRSVSDDQRLRGSLSNDTADSRAPRDQRLKPAPTSLPSYSEYPSHAPPRYSQTLPRRNRHDIWYPPASAFSSPGLVAPASTTDLPGTAPEYHSPEWRKYPAFPAAYPPTPLPALTSLPSSVTAESVNDHPGYPPIPEGEQDFDETLEGRREEYPGFVHNSSNSNKIPTINSYEESSDPIGQLDEDTFLDDNMCSSEAGLSEDDFGASLRTPSRFPEAMPSSACSSVDSLASPPTTAQHASPLRTKITSDSLSSGSSSLAGRKRLFQGTARSALPISHSRDATLRGRPTPSFISQDPLQSSTSEDEGEGDDDDGTAVAAKRQRVLEPLKRKSTVRPAPRGMDDARKVPLSSKNAAARGSAITTLPVPQMIARTRAGSVTTNNKTIKGRRPTLSSRQVVRGRPQEVTKSSSTSSSQSGTWKGRA